MKKFKKVFAFVAIMMGMSTMAIAQDGFSVRAGGNFPIGTFAQGDAVDNALLNATSELGAAATGFNAGVKCQFSVVGNLGLFATADFFYNELNEETQDALKVENDDVTLPTYMNVPIMLGANYKVLDFASVALWAEAGAGLNFRNISANTISAAVGTLVSGSMETVYDLSYSFAWQVGIGVTLAETLSLGVHYYGFGAADVKGESTASANIGGLLDTESKPVAFTNGKLNPSMLVVRLGYTF